MGGEGEEGRCPGLMSEGEGARCPGMMSEGERRGLSYLSHDACDVPTLSLST